MECPVEGKEVMEDGEKENEGERRKMRAKEGEGGRISILVICQEFLKKILIYFSGKRVTLIDLRRKIQRRTSVLVDI